MFLMSLSQQARQSRHAFPWLGAGQLLPVVTTVDVRGQEPGAGPSTFVALSLIVRLAGTRSCGILERSPASRVGSQCATSAVNLQTWNILRKCSRLCKSPESCQRNQRDARAFMSAAMVAAQSSRSMLASRRCIASLTFGNLLRPFNA